MVEETIVPTPAVGTVPLPEVNVGTKGLTARIKT